MRAPEFWYQPQIGFGAHLLSPLAWIWARLAQRRAKRGGVPVGGPILCVGNIHIGGVGKTPTVIYLAQALREAGLSPVVLSRGFGGSERVPIAVTPDHDAGAVGDEALLIANFAPVVVARDRVAGAKLAMELGDLIIMDDGFQDPALLKDISLLVVDSDMGWGNGLCFPAGPLRERVEDGISRADMLLAIGGGARLAEIEQAAAGKPIFRARLAPVEMGINWQGKRLIAFAGIGRPEKFFDTLIGLGADLVRTHSFGDHQPISERALLRMQREARLHSAELITTEKDAVRLPKSWQGQVLSLPVRLEVEKGELVGELMRLGPVLA